MTRVLRIALSLIAAVATYFIVIFIIRFLPFPVPEDFSDVATVSLSVIIGLIFYFFLSSKLAKKVFESLATNVEKLSKISVKDLLVGVIGAIAGLGIANLVGIALSKFGPVGYAGVIILNIIFGYMGYKVAQAKSDEINLPTVKDSRSKQIPGRPKILDTSVIIDGRILDILQTGFVEGKVIVPDFVLEELRHIADSTDSLKRNRGRRGLDILNEIQKQTLITVEIVDMDFKEVAEVDSKLLKLAARLDGFVVTNDFNLNKVAEFQGVRVLNINDLANAVKPVVLPGEEMHITVIKQGKEPGQGVAYLNDGTMIVVEGGERYIGEETPVVVTSVLQTSAGRMIFTKTHDEY